jgi:GAF domain-containing protein
VIQATTRLTGAQAGAFVYHADGGVLTHAVAGAEAHAELAAGLPALVAPWLGERESRLLADVNDAASPVTPPPAMPIASYLSVPVIGRRGDAIGALVFGHARPRMFTSELERLVTRIAASLAIAMDNARLFQEARSLIEAIGRSRR